MSRDPDSLPTPRDPAGPCPWCGRVSNFKVPGNTRGNLKTQATPDGLVVDRAWAVITCQGCNCSTVVITDQQNKGVHWYPTPGSAHLDPAVPDVIGSCYDEGMRCQSIGANRAAAVMFRSALSLYVKDKGSEQARGERHLKVALGHMKDEGTLHPSLWDWADHLNQLGNEGAHPEDYDDVTAEEAKALGQFVQHLIRHEYEMPAQLQRARGLAGD